MGIGSILSISLSEGRMISDKVEILATDTRLGEIEWKTVQGPQNRLAQFWENVTFEIQRRRGHLKWYYTLILGLSSP